MSIMKEKILKDGSEPLEFIEVSCEIEIAYDENNPSGTVGKTDELHHLMHPRELAESDDDESESERHYIRFDDNDEDQFYSSESDDTEETTREEIDSVEEGMMLIFEDQQNISAPEKVVNKKIKSKSHKRDRLLHKEVPVAVKEEVVDLNEEVSNVSASCKLSSRPNAYVQDIDFINRNTASEPGGSGPGSKWHLGPNDRFATIASSDSAEPLIVVVRNVDSEKPICEPLKRPSNIKPKANVMVKFHKLGKTNKKKTKQVRYSSIPQDSKAVSVPAPVSLFPRICLKDTMPLNCVLCSIECSNRKALIEHVKSHSTDKKSFECPTCKKTFTQQCNLKRHMRCHSGERPFSCPYCKKLFADQGYLTTHLRYHTNTKPYTCQHCDKAFFDRSNYVKHLKSHSGEKPYPCPICNKSFLQQSDLTRHTRVHSGERPFKCDHCERSFTQHGDLTTHLRHHTGERPFVCSDCQKTFANKRYLNSHVKGRICLKKKGTVGVKSNKSSKEIKLLSARELPVVTKRLMIKKELKV